MSDVPIIDLAGASGGDPAERRRVARAIDDACREIGFFAIVGHGVPDTLVDDVRRVAHTFFELPPAHKLAARHPLEDMNRGYHAAGRETLSAANDAAAPPDLKEYFHVGPIDVGDVPTTQARSGAGTSSRTCGRRRRPASSEPSPRTTGA